MTSNHEMRMVAGRIRAVYIEDDGREYYIVDGDEIEIRAAGKETIRYSDDGSVCMVWADGEPVRCPTQDDMDNLPTGDDMTADEVAALDD